MPRIMTMNGDQLSVATAPLDLSTGKHGSAGARTADCRGCGRDARATSGSPAAPACSGTVRLEIHSPAGRSASSPEAGTAGTTRKRPADKSVLRLPLRKRPIRVEPDIQTQSPVVPERGDRFPSAGDSDAPLRESSPSHSERAGYRSRVDVVHRRVEEAGQAPDGYPIRVLQPLTYGHHSMCGLHPDPNHPVFLHQAENLLTSISIATRQDEDGDTALHIAVVQGELAIVFQLIQLLLLARRAVDIYNNLRQTPLHLAVITQQANMVEALLRAGADPAALDRNGQTALHLCCEYNRRDCLSVVLSLPSSSSCLEIKNYEGLSPLHLAVLRGQRNLARMLLAEGADINAMDIKSGQSPLMHAVESNNVDMLHFLVESGCDINSQSYSGNTALHSACARGQVDNVRLLLKSGADSSLKNYHNDTPVMVAKNKKIADVLRGRVSKQIRLQDQHCVSGSSHGSNVTDNGSPSPNHSRGCSPSTTQHVSHHCTSQSPQTPSTLGFPFY